MRILFVNEKRGFFGGVEQCLWDSARGLSARGHACHLAYGVLTPRNVPAFDRAFASVSACAELDGERAQGLARLIARVQPDLLYVHKVPAIQPVIDAAGATPVVRMIHDHDLTCPRRHKYDAYRGRTCQRAAGLRCLLDLAFLERAPGSLLGMRLVNVCNRLDELARHRGLAALFVGSEYMRHELVRNGCRAELVQVLAPCMDVDVPAATPVPDAARLLFVGQLIRGKGVDLLLRALALLPATYHLDVVGSGNAAHALAALARDLAVTDRVTFHGWVDRPRTVRLFQAARMLVVPSRWPEPFGMVGVEAMAHGRPVVAFDVGGVSGWLAHGVSGLLVPENDVHALATAIDRVHTAPGMAAALGGAARVLYEDAYRYPQLVDQLEAALESALARARPGQEVLAP